MSTEYDLSSLFSQADDTFKLLKKEINRVVEHINENKVSVRKKAPWPDFLGNDIYEGDVIEHPASGETGLVIFLPFLKDYEYERDCWRVVYKHSTHITSDLGLQIGDKGQARVVKIK